MEALLTCLFIVLVGPFIAMFIYICFWPLVAIAVIVGFGTPLVWIFTGLSAEPTNWELVKQGTGVFGLLCIVAYTFLRDHTPKRSE